MNKKNIIILIALFCFTSVLLIFPLFCNAADSYNMDQVNDNDFGSEPDDASYGDTFTGSTGTTYELQQENPTPAQQQALDDADLNASGAWVPVSESSGSDKDDWKCLPDGTCKASSSGYSTKSQCEAHCEPHGTYKICRKPYTTLFGADANKLYCKSASWSGVRPTDQCRYDSDCGSSGATTPKYSCMQCRGEVCSTRYSDTPCDNTCHNNDDCSSGSNTPTSGQTYRQCNICYNTTYNPCKPKWFSTPACATAVSYGYTLCTTNADCQGTSPTTPSSTTPPTTIPPCAINKFELPKRAWVDIETIASWSTNNCDTAEINCISEDCIEGVESLSGSVSIGINQNKNFTINAPGTYRYELRACNENNCDTYEDVLGTGLEYIEIEALHLPWWQEIIPVLPDNLQGFLKGIFRI